MILGPRTLAALFLALATLTATPRQNNRTPLTPQVAAEMLRLAKLRPTDVVYDLGSLAVIPVLASKRGAKAFGIGLDHEQFEAATAAARQQGAAERVTFVEGNLMTAAFAEATVVTLDLSPDLNLILEPILRRSLRPGSRIVSHRYGIGAWRADERVRASDGADLFLWTVPRLPARTPDIFFVPTDQSVAEQMLALAGVTGRDTVYDLGSGDGRLPVLAAQKYGASGVGVEIDPKLVAISRQVATDAGVQGKVRFIEGDLFKTNLSNATVVTLFLSPSINRRLAATLRRQLKAGSRVVSHQFDMGDWKPDRTMKADDGTTLFLWTIRKP